MGGSSSSQQPVQTTQTSDPWSGAQPYLQQTMASAQGLYGSDIGNQPYTGQFQSDNSPWTVSGVDTKYGLALQDQFGSAGVNAARNLGTQMQGTQGLTAGQTGYVIPGMQEMANRYSNVYNEAAGQQNPYLLAQIAANDRRIADRINSSMSGAGRYGSGAHTDVMSRTLAEAANPILAQDYAQRQQNRLNALAGQQGVYNQLSNVYDTGLQRAGQWAQLMPSLDAARYMGADQMLGLGQWAEGKINAQLANQRDIWNAQQARPWEQLARYQAIVAGPGALGGTKVTTSPSTQPPLSSRILGGAIAGGGLGSIFGLPGAAIGAGAGGLLGLL
jgi:hypothetical protein